MGDSRIYLLLGDCDSPGTGSDTDASKWGNAFLIKKNRGETFTMQGKINGSPTCPTGTKLTSNHLIPVMSLSHNLRRTGNISTPSEAGGFQYGAMMLTVHPWMAVRMANIMRNLYASDDDDTPNRCNFKIYLTRSGAAEKGGDQKTHNWLVISGSNGQINSVNDGLVDDYLSLVVTAEIWRWQSFKPDGADPQDVSSAAFSYDGADIKGKHWC